jgi:hypothetical protein
MASDQGLVLVCKHCRWRPPDDLQMNLVEAHFDIEDGHNPTDIRLEMVAWCRRCDTEMDLNTTVVVVASGNTRRTYSCPSCRRTYVAVQKPGAGDAKGTR